MSQHIEAIFENGVFRPLHPVDLPDQQRVTLQMPVPGDKVPATERAVPLDDVGSEDDADVEEDITYDPLPPDDVKTIRVKFQFIGKGEPLPYHLDEEELDALNELE